MMRNKYKITILWAALILALPFSCFAEGVIPAKQDEAILTISKGIEIVLKDNRLIKIAIPENDMAFQDSLISRSALLPALNITASETLYKDQPGAKFDSSVIPSSGRSSFSYGIDVYQTLFDFGKNLSNYKASKEAYKARKARTESVKRVATLEFIIAYFDVLETEKMIKVFEKEVESLNSYLTDIQHLYEQGAAVKNDLLPAKVKLADAKQRLIAARNRKDITLIRLNNILARPHRENTLVQDVSMQLPVVPGIDDSLKMAQDLRPEIVFYQDQINASVLTERAKAVENFPVFYADAGYAYDQNKYQAHESNMTFELGAKMKFYDGGQARAQLMKERQNRRKLNEQKEKIVEDIKFEVEDSHIGLKDAREKVVVAKDALEQAQENVRVYRVKYNAGSATPTDVLDAIALQTRAETNFCTSEYELKRNYAKLIYSVGEDLAEVYSKMENQYDGTAK